MIIEKITEPPARKSGSHTRLVYGELVAAIATPGQWVRVPLAEIVGKDTLAKRRNIIQSLRKTGVRTRTRVDADYVYVTLKKLGA